MLIVGVIEKRRVVADRELEGKATDGPRFPRREMGLLVKRPAFAEEIEAVATTLNSRPRKTLGWKTPAEAFNEQLLLEQAGVATTD